MKTKENIINILGILLCIIVFIIIPLKVLSPVDFQNADNYHEDLTAFSQNVVNNWLIDGITNDKFIMYCDFASVEFENNNNRCIYLSYPPGSLIPLYSIAKVNGQKEISISFIKYFIQFEYYISILLLGILFYLCLKYIELQSRLAIIFLPVLFSSLWAFLPYNAYYMNNVYFTDQAVILLSISFFLVEIALYNKQLKRREFFLQILSCVILFTGILTDYYFYCIAFVAVCIRIMNNFREHQGKSLFFKLLSNTWFLMVSVVFASALFLIQLLNVPKGLELLAVTFFVRSGNGAEWGGIEVLARHLGNGCTILFIPVLISVTFFCLIFPLIRKNYSEQKQVIINGLSLIVLSPVLHTLILRQHSIIHEFSMLKYNLVFVYIIFILTCWLYINYINPRSDRSKKYSKIFLKLIICLIIILIMAFQVYNQSFYKIRTKTVDHFVAKFIKENTNYYDVVYSPDYEINWNPPQNLAISKKRIYRIASLWEIPVQNLPDHAVINILISKKTYVDQKWNTLRQAVIYSTGLDNFYLFKFSKNAFQSLMQSK